jgi:hypothetical protein
MTLAQPRLVDVAQTLPYICLSGWEARRGAPLGFFPLPAAFSSGSSGLHLLYLDDSGSAKNAQDRHVILAGVAVFERQPFWFSKQLDRLAAEISPEAPDSVEFRGGDIITGRKHWRKIPKDQRLDVYDRALDILKNSREARLFGAAIHKAAVSPNDPIEYAFEQMCNRFDRFLGRLHRLNDTQRGLLVLDESSYETTLQNLARNFRTIGHRWGQLYNMAEVPLFVDSKATRMIQFADLVAHGMRHYFEHGNSRYFDRIAHKFDPEGGVTHGLVHITPRDSPCNCFSCRQKKNS